MTGWPKTNKSTPCPRCGHTDGSCRFSPDQTKLLCLRVADGCMTHRDGSKVTAKANMGWVHSLVNGKSNGHKVKHPHKDEHMTITEVRTILDKHQSDLTDDHIGKANELLGIHKDTLKNFGIGYDDITGCWSFPMSNHKRQPVGIHLRAEDGRKRAVKGSQNGLFIPINYSVEPPSFLSESTPLLLATPEGLTDSASCLDLGFRAIGRPSNCGGIDFLRDMLKQDGPHNKQDLVLIVDNDPVKWSMAGVPFVPGWEGGLTTIDAVFDYCNTVRVIRCPCGCKDIRKWMLESGGTTQERGDAIQRLIDEAECLSRSKIKEKLDSMTGFKLKGQIDALFCHPDRCKLYAENPAGKAKALSEARTAYVEWLDKHPDLRHS